MEENSFIMKDENGKEVKYDVLFTFQMEETGKDYIAYTDNTTDDEGNVLVYTATYTLTENNQMKLAAIETEEEMKTFDTILKTTQEELRNSMETNNQE